MKQKLAVIGFTYLLALFFASVFIKIWLVIVITAVLLIISAVIAKTKFKNNLICATLIGAAVSLSAYSVTYYDLQAEKDVLCDDSIHSVTAKIVEKKNIGNDLSIYILDGKADNIAVKFLMYAEDYSVQTCDILHFNGKFKVIENSSAFKGADYYLADGIVLSCTAKSDFEITKADSRGLFFYLDKYRKYIADKLDILFPDRGGALMKGIFLGDKTAFSAYERYCIKAAGAAHITAVSGMHLTLIVHILASILTMIFAKAFPGIRLAVMLLAIICFMAFFGFTASVMRAGLMLLIHYSGKLFFRESACLNSLGFAILIITLHSPLACHDIGFILSVVTTIGAGEISPKVSEYVCKKFPKLKENIADSVSCAVCASLMGLPLSILYFDMFSVVGAIVTLITAPLFTVSLTLMLMFTLCGGLPELLLYPAHLCCEVISGIFEAAALMPYSHFTLSSEISAFAFVAIIFIVLVIFFSVNNKKRFIACVVSGAVMLCTYTVIMTADKLLPNGETLIIMRSDGENSCVLISADEYTVGVISGGGGNVCSTLYSLMMGENVRYLDCLLLAEDKNNSVKVVEQFFDGKAYKVVLDDELLQLCESAKMFVNTDLVSSYEFTEDNYTLKFDSKGLLADISGVKIKISDISDIDKNAINICYGYEREKPDTAMPIFLINKRQKELTENSVPLYCCDAEITVTANGGIFCDFDYIY